jgi:hypothetical protein
MRTLHPGRFCGTKTAGVCTSNSHSGSSLNVPNVPTFQRSNDFSTYPLYFQTLPHSFALFCTHTKLNPFLFKRFRTLCKKTPGVGVGGTNC